MLKALTMALLIAAANPASAQTSSQVAAFERALVAMDADNWQEAKTAARSAGPVASDVIEWLRLRAGEGTFDEVREFLNRRASWPGLALLRKRSEAAVPIDRRANDVISFFKEAPPQTGTGAVALISAYRAIGQTDKALNLAKNTWVTTPLTSADETRLLKFYERDLKSLDDERLDAMLWLGATEDVERMRLRVGPDHRKLADARVALRKRSKGVDALVAAVPKALRDTEGLTYDRMRWRARSGNTEGAIELMLTRDPDRLDRAEKWAGWRRSFARNEMRAGRSDRAYKLASEHGLESGNSFADLEWLSGYIALTYDQDGARALRHFLRFRGAVESPISLGRAGYWEGRAHELLGDPESAQLAFAFGAEYQTSFYGQLAAEKIGREMNPNLTGRKNFPPWNEQSFAKSSIFQAARYMMEAGQTYYSQQFLRHLTDSLTPEQIGSLSNFVLAEGEPYIAVMIGKHAARKGVVVPHAYFPTPNLGLSRPPVSEELILSIARRESEFNPTAQSSAGARGLMQLMPGTAKDLSRSLGLTYNRDRLITDPVYNAQLGAAYLDDLLLLFDGNIVMTAAGYNAGPGRSVSWMNELGDPLRGEVDVIDWIEHVPFNETRNYIMRVSESLAVYRARLTGRIQPLQLSRELVATPGHVRLARGGAPLRPKARPDPLTD